MHDLAPGAQLSFANADTSLSFMEAVNALAADNDVVVDDLGFLGEPANGQSSVSRNTADALNNPANRIRTYVTSVGNAANDHYFGTFVASNVDGQTINGVTSPGRLHLFRQTNETTDVLGLVNAGRAIQGARSLCFPGPHPPPAPAGARIVLHATRQFQPLHAWETAAMSTIAGRTGMRLVRPGVRRIGATSPNPVLDPVAFINADGRHAVMVKVERDVGPLTVAGLPAGTYAVAWTPHGGQHATTHLGDVTIASGQALATAIPGDGVLTIVTKSGGAMPQAAPRSR